MRREAPQAGMHRQTDHAINSITIHAGPPCVPFSIFRLSWLLSLRFTSRGQGARTRQKAESYQFDSAIVIIMTISDQAVFHARLHLIPSILNNTTYYRIHSFGIPTANRTSDSIYLPVELMILQGGGPNEREKRNPDGLYAVLP